MNYTIQSGDTLSAIARANGITLKALQNVNANITDPNKITAGEVINIPEDAVLVSGTDDPATNAAIVGCYSEVDGALEPCPLQDDWLTVKPLRYAVSDADNSVKLADELAFGPKMPKLKEHKYIARELNDHTVYLFNLDDQYLIEVLYENGIASDARGVFGNIPAEVKAGLPILKQKKGAKAILWLTIAPLSEMRLANLQANVSSIPKLGQVVDFSQAASGNAPDTRPLYDIQNLLANLQVSENRLKWTIPALEPVTDTNSIMVPYQAQTPNNHYAVCLVDAIGITTDLCREFSIAYELTMSSISTSQHPLQMAKLTKHIINNEMVKAESKVTPSVPNDISYPAALSLGKERAVTLDALQANASVERKNELEKYLHVQEMEDYLKNNNNTMLKLKQQLESLAEDWLTWLNDGLLDLALAWLDDAESEQIALKEALLFAMTNNIEATDKGIGLANKWTQSLYKTVNNQPIQESGVGAHFLTALGFAKPLLSKAQNG